MSVLTAEQFAELMLACWKVTFAAVVLGMVVGGMLRDFVFVFLLRRFKAWRRFDRAMRRLFA